MKSSKNNLSYKCWFANSVIENEEIKKEYEKFSKNIVTSENTQIINTATTELINNLKKILQIKIILSKKPISDNFITLGTIDKSSLINNKLTDDEKSKINKEGFIIKIISSNNNNFIIIAGKNDNGVLYGVFSFLKNIKILEVSNNLYRIENPSSPLRIINHWDNMNGTIERGYAGQSIFYNNNKFLSNFKRIRDYARLLSSIGINGVVLNNVNVKEHETYLPFEKNLLKTKNFADIFREFGIKVYFSINYASPMIIDNLPTADPLNPKVKKWWRDRAKIIYNYIPDFGGFLVKADSEFTPGPFTYNRNHAEGANMLAEALEAFGGIVIWRCFVYNCTQDWRDRSIDRARSAYDNFKPLDGKFKDNVILQIKNGPMDFQVREPVSPLFGGLEKTNQIIELQVTQEYTGQQKHLCYLGTQWQEILDFDTNAKGKDSKVKKMISGKIFKQNHHGFAGVSNIGSDQNWTGHDLAQANLYAFGRLAWDPDISAKEIAEEWIKLTFGNEKQLVETLRDILMDSWEIYEKYTAPLGIGWMVNPNHHYGPSVDGYEYSKWGTYHRADSQGIGIDRSVKSGTGYAGLYHKPNSENYESPETCPDELILFFHHLPYNYKLKSGKTIIEHIYDTHFEGVKKVEELISKWKSIKNFIDDERYDNVLKKFEEQLEHSKEWRDVINTYFYRKTGINDRLGRKIY